MSMTINHLLIQLEQYQIEVLLYLVAIPVICLVYNLLHKPERRIRSPHKYVYSFLIYATAIPGTMGFVLTAYTLFFTRQNLLDVNPIFYFLTMISMVISFMIIAKETNLNHIPGFGRIVGLFSMLALSMFCVLMLMKVNIFVGFFASFEYLIVGIIIIFILINMAAKKILGK